MIVCNHLDDQAMSILSIDTLSVSETKPLPKLDEIGSGQIKSGDPNLCPSKKLF